MEEPISILLIEDDPSLGESLQEYLGGKGHSVTWLRDERNLDLGSLASFQVVVLDLILQSIPGERILDSIRREAPELPVLVLTAKAGIDDKQACFQAGADDYLTKPFEPLELLLRIQALRRREPEKSVFYCGDVEVDLDSQLVHKAGKEVPLSSRCWDLLCLLLQNRGKVVSKEKILDEVWSDAVVTDDVIRYYIKELRRILPENSIETHKGRGWRFR